MDPLNSIHTPLGFHGPQGENLAPSKPKKITTDEGSNFKVNTQHYLKQSPQEKPLTLVLRGCWGRHSKSQFPCLFHRPLRGTCSSVPSTQVFILPLEVLPLSQRRWSSPWIYRCPVSVFPTFKYSLRWLPHNNVGRAVASWVFSPLRPYSCGELQLQQAEHVHPS